jgi:ABC-type multidrug transport system ATPase subunit
MQLECKKIEFRYPGTQKVLFNQLSFGFSQSGFHAIFGPSGVGKTSLARIITGQLTADTGVVSSVGIDKRLYTYNLERLPGWSTIGHHLDRITAENKVAQRDELIKVFELFPLLNRRFSQLSMGQQNRVNLLRYLVQDFQLLIMDESLANVDEKTRTRILLAMKEMFSDVILVMISHNVVEVAKFCREIWVLRGVHKTPQAALIQGQDCVSDESLNQTAWQKTMLEIMNAA